MPTVGHVRVNLSALGGKGFSDAFERAAKSVGAFKAEVKSSSDEASSGLSKAMAKMVAAAVSFAAASKAVGIGKQMVMLASDFNETGNVISQVFGSGARDINSWAETTGDAMSRSTNQMREFAGSMGALLGPMVQNQEETTEMSKAMARLAVDMGSFSNVADKEVLTALRSGLSGESEPLKRFGIIMQDNTLEAYRLSQGIKVSYAAMDVASKTALRYNFILENTRAQQGDAERTADGLANTIKALEGQLVEMGTQIGQQAVPHVKDLMDRMSEMLRVLEGGDWSGVFSTIASAIKAMTETVLVAVKGISELYFQLKKYAAFAKFLFQSEETTFTAPGEDEHRQSQETIDNMILRLNGEKFQWRDGKMVLDLPDSMKSAPESTRPNAINHAWRAGPSEAAKTAKAEQEAYGKGFTSWEDAAKIAAENARNAGDAIREVEAYFEEAAKHTAEFEEGLKKNLYDASKGFKENIEKSFTDISSVDWTKALVGMFSQGGQKAMGDLLTGGIGADLASDAMGLFKKVVPAFDMSADEVNKVAGVLKQGAGAMKQGFSMVMTAVSVVGEAIQSFISAVEEGVKALVGVFKSTGGRAIDDVLQEPRLQGGLAAAGAVFSAMGVLIATKLGEPLLLLAPLFAGLAVTMAAWDLSTQTESFKRFQDAMGGAVDIIVKQLEPFWRMLMPVAGLLGAMAVAVGQFLLMVLPGPVLMHLLFDSMKMLGIIILNVIVSFENLHVVLLDMLSNLAMTRDERERFRRERDIAAANRHNTEGAINTLTNMSFTESADLANQLADAFNASDSSGGSTASDYGVPSGYKSGLQAWKAMDPTGSAQDQMDEQEEQTGLLQHIANMIDGALSGNVKQDSARVSDRQSNMAVRGTNSPIASRYGG